MYKNIPFNIAHLHDCFHKKMTSTQNCLSIEDVLASKFMNIKAHSRMNCPLLTRYNHAGWIN